MFKRWFGSAVDFLTSLMGLDAVQQSSMRLAECKTVRRLPKTVEELRDASHSKRVR